MRRSWVESAQTFFAVAGLVVAWEVLCRVLEVPKWLLPAPSQIVEETWEIRNVLPLHFGATLAAVVGGFVLAVVTGIPLAVLVVYSPFMRRVVFPVLLTLQSVPKVALAPILVVVLGSNELPRIVITVLVAFFPLVISSATGLMSVPPELIELSRACKASKWSELWRIRLPYAIPFIFAGLKVAISLAVVGAVVAEFVNADSGLGFLIVTSTAFFKVPVAFGALIILSIMGVVLFQLVVIAERVFFPWSTGNAMAAS